MKICGLEHYEPIRTAMKRLGFKVTEIVKHRRRTVIIVTRYKSKKVNYGEGVVYGKEQR